MWERTIYFVCAGAKSFVLFFLRDVLHVTRASDQARLRAGHRELWCTWGRRHKCLEFSLLFSFIVVSLFSVSECCFMFDVYSHGLSGWLRLAQQKPESWNMTILQLRGLGKKSQAHIRILESTVRLTLCGSGF